MTTNKKYILKPQMIGDIQTLLDRLLPESVDIEFLKPYEDLRPEDGNISVTELPILASKFLYAFDLCKDAESVAMAFHMAAKVQSEKERALAFMIRSIEYFDSVGQKPTDKAKEAFVDQDEKYVDSLNKMNQWKVLSIYFSNTKQSFEHWHNWCKKILDADARSLTHAGMPRNEAE